MRFRESLNGILKRYFTLRYGEVEAAELLALHGKNRAQRLAMLDEYGSQADLIIRRRKRQKLVNAAYSAQAFRMQIETQLKSLEFQISLIQIDIDASMTDVERERHQATLALNATKIQQSKAMLIEAQRDEERTAKILEAHPPVYPAVEDIGLPTLDVPAPRTLPMDEMRARAVAHELMVKMLAGLDHFYQEIFGKQRFREILLLNKEERLQAVRELDLVLLWMRHNSTQIYLVIARQAGVKLITSKNSILRMIEYTKSILDDIPQDTDDSQLQNKAKKCEHVLDDLAPFLDEATRIVEEFKDVVRELENRLRTPARRPPRLDSNTDWT